MSKIINTNYKTVPTYHIPCACCGALIEFKEYELSFYSDIDDDPMVEWKCPNCRKRSHMYRGYLKKYRVDIPEVDAEEVTVDDLMGKKSLWQRVKDFWNKIDNFLSVEYV